MTTYGQTLLRQWHVHPRSWFAAALATLLTATVALVAVVVVNLAPSVAPSVGRSDVSRPFDRGLVESTGSYAERYVVPGTFVAQTPRGGLAEFAGVSTFLPTTSWLADWRPSPVDPPRVRGGEAEYPGVDLPALGTSEGRGGLPQFADVR